MSIIDQIAQHYPEAKRWVGAWDRHCLTVHSHRFDVTMRDDGDEIRVCAWVGRGRDGGSRLEGRTYKSAAGALRMIAKYIGQ